MYGWFRGNLLSLPMIIDWVASIKVVYCMVFNAPMVIESCGFNVVPLIGLLNSGILVLRHSKVILKNTINK